MRKTKILILLLTSYLLFIGCGEKDPSIPHKMPPATQEGKNTAGCYINGELFVLSGNGGVQQTNPYAEFTDYYFDGYKKISFGFSDFNFTRKRIGVYIYIKKDSLLKKNVPLQYSSYQTTYKIKENKDVLIAGAGLNKLDSQDDFSIYGNKNSYINFTKIDKQNKILSGTFSFEVKNEKTGKILKVTDGRFDLKMKYYK